jgi:hypothetical protein
MASAAQLRIICKPDDPVGLCEHKHLCPCGACWKHDADEFDGEDDFETAHSCPACGRKVYARVQEGVCCVLAQMLAFVCEQIERLEREERRFSMTRWLNLLADSVAQGLGWTAGILIGLAIANALGVDLARLI